MLGIFTDSPVFMKLTTCFAVLCDLEVVIES